MRTKDEENERRQRKQLLTAAWKLFRQKGYAATTMSEILAEAECSKGRFYYYFHAKAELLDSLYELFDQKYFEVYRALPEGLSCEEKLFHIHSFMFSFMSENIGSDLLTNLYLSQLQHDTGIEFWSRQRGYVQIVSEIIAAGQSKNEVRSDLTVEEIVDDLIAMERSQLIDWCLKLGKTPLAEDGAKKFAMQFIGYRKAFEHT